jgi:STE24 endopeptidase
MQIAVLAALLVSMAMSYPEAVGKLMAPGWQTAPAVGTYVFGAAGIAAANTALGLRAIVRGGRQLHQILRRHNLLSMLASLWLILGLAGAIFLGYGRWLMVDLHLAWVPLAGQLAVMAPFVVALLAVWIMDYPFYFLTRQMLLARRANPAARRPWTLGQYVFYNCRHHLLFILVLVSLIILAWDLLYLYAWPHISAIAAGKHLLLAAMGASALAVFFLAPLLIVRIWKTEPLADRPLRRSLEEMCRQLGLRYRNILTWKSDGQIANAGVMGLAGPVRYVLLSDGLLENADHHQIKAIFAHEAGHIASHHIFYSALFAVASAGLCGYAALLLGAFMGLDYFEETAATAGLVVVAWGLGFGWVSRRFERQCDVMSAWAIERPALNAPKEAPNASAEAGRITLQGAVVFARALGEVARLNGIPVRQRSWRHGSIATRIDYVLWLASTGGSRRSIDRVVRRIKLAIWLLLAGAVAIIATS